MHLVALGGDLHQDRGKRVVVAATRSKVPLRPVRIPGFMFDGQGLRKRRRDGGRRASGGRRDGGGGGGGGGGGCVALQVVAEAAEGDEEATEHLGCVGCEMGQTSSGKPQRQRYALRSL